MYEKFETEISQKYLKEVFAVLEEPICLMGGWAVYYYANELFKKYRGADYVGSRDIDLGFPINRKWESAELQNSSFAKSLGILEKKLDFKLQGFRLLKEFHTETRKELSVEEAKATAPAYIFDLYVDLMVSGNHKDFHKTFGFVPADEPLLENVFTTPLNRIEIELFGKRIYLPSIEVLLAMKLNSVINRDKEQKQLKDLYDIVALALYSNRPIDREKLQSSYRISLKSKEKFHAILDKQCKDGNWASLFGISGEVAKKTILQLIEGKSRPPA